MEQLVCSEILGRGGFSTVHKATSTIYPTPFALKRIPKHRLEAEDLIRLVGNEVSIHSCCDHPNIVKYYDYFEDEQHINIVLELCQDGDCAQLLRKHGKLPQHQGKFEPPESIK